VARVALSERVEAGRRFCEAMRLQVLTGAAELDRLYYWSFRCLDAERGGEAPQAAYEAHLARMRRLLDDLSPRIAATLARADEETQARFFVREAEYWLELTRGGELEPAREALLAAAQAAWEGCRDRFRADGKGLEAASLASVRLLQAGRDAGRPERGCYEAHLERILELDRELRRRERGGPLPPIEVVTGEYFRWEAEYMHALVAPKRGRSPEAFAERRYAAAREAYRSLRAGFRPGEGTSERMYLWSLRWLRSQRDLAEERGQPPQERATLAEHLERLAGFRNMLRAELPPGVAFDLGALDFFVQEADAWLEALPPA
jgi:hypothetical protein